MLDDWNNLNILQHHRLQRNDCSFVGINWSSFRTVNDFSHKYLFRLRILLLRKLNSDRYRRPSPKAGQSHGARLLCHQLLQVISKFWRYMNKLKFWIWTDKQPVHFAVRLPNCQGCDNNIAINYWTDSSDWNMTFNNESIVDTESVVDDKSGSAISFVAFDESVHSSSNSNSDLRIYFFN